MIVRTTLHTWTCSTELIVSNFSIYKQEFFCVLPFLLTKNSRNKKIFRMHAQKHIASLYLPFCVYAYKSTAKSFNCHFFFSVSNQINQITHSSFLFIFLFYRSPHAQAYKNEPHKFRWIFFLPKTKGMCIRFYCYRFFFTYTHTKIWHKILLVFNLFIFFQMYTL